MHMNDCRCSFVSHPNRYLGNTRSQSNEAVVSVDTNGFADIRVALRCIIATCFFVPGPQFHVLIVNVPLRSVEDNWQTIAVQIPGDQLDLLPYGDIDNLAGRGDIPVTYRLGVVDFNTQVSTLISASDRR
ncbi:hypothetical protein [Bifidobacterium thermophilum]|uniref:hypothetical protein n=1 Tax=Bifidobacterium thermophilum TaxID=33905 RepID=UPI00142ED6C2|nr:hypothetical protein [Bifidobacterium thermophilum]MDW8486828.1 hypothetical protein [Bifidobacterium thermophilum]